MHDILPGLQNVGSFLLTMSKAYRRSMCSTILPFALVVSEYHPRMCAFRSPMITIGVLGHTYGVKNLQPGNFLPGRRSRVTKGRGGGGHKLMRA